MLSPNNSAGRAAGRNWAALRAAQNRLSNGSSGSSADPQSAEIDPLTNALHLSRMMGVTPPPPPTNWKDEAQRDSAAGRLAPPASPEEAHQRVERARRDNERRRLALFADHGATGRAQVGVAGSSTDPLPPAATIRRSASESATSVREMQEKRIMERLRWLEGTSEEDREEEFTV